ncbi:MAG: IS21 family transposase, partial [Polyangiaceae bacterium]
AQEMLDLVAELYIAEHAADAQGLTGTAKLEFRKQRAGPVRARMKAWLDAQRDRHPPKSPIGAAIRYADNQWEELGVFLDDERVPLGRVGRWRGDRRTWGVAGADRFRVHRRCLNPRHGSVSSARSSRKARIVDAATGEVVDVELFVAALGASNFTYAEATYTQRGPDWIASHVRMLEYFGGVPAALVPDQLKSGVTRSCLYEPEAQRTYEELAEHYGTTVLPARPSHPRDKAKVEVQIAQRWLLARIRDEVFHSLGELNARLRELLIDLNARVMRRYGKSRRDLFEQMERAALRPLPSTRFEYAAWAKARVNIDYHVAVEGHLYSVPYRLVHEQVEVRLGADVVEVLHRRGRVAAHRRSYLKGGFTTETEHMPSAHRAHAEWTPSRIVEWAGKVGAATRDLCEAILADRPHPEQGFRSCLGILRLGKRYGEVRLEAACNRALRVRARSYRHVESILKNGLDRVAATEEQTSLSLAHENVRGRDYYH